MPQKYRVHREKISISRSENRQSLHEFHERVYRKIFDREGLQYTDEELSLHRELGLGQFEEISAEKIRNWISWLKKLEHWNLNSAYLDEECLNFEIIRRLAAIASNARKQPRLLFLVWSLGFKVTGLKAIKSFLRKRKERKDIDVKKF